MKKLMRVFIGAMMAAVCMMAAVPAFAADNPEVSIPVKVSLSGTLPSPAEDYTIELKADNDAYPMPEEDDTYTMTIKGADTKNLPAISYDKVGVYKYTIRQIAGSNKDCTYDDSVYSLTVYVTFAEKGGTLEATAVLYKGTEGDKLSAAEFKNVYKTVTPTATPTTTPAKSADTGDNSSPMLYVLLATVCVGLIVTQVLINKNKNKNTK